LAIEFWLESRPIPYHAGQDKSCPASVFRPTDRPLFTPLRVHHDERSQSVTACDQFFNLPLEFESGGRASPDDPAVAADQEAVDTPEIE